MYSSIVKNKRNTVVIFTAFIAIISAIGFFFSYVSGDSSIFLWSLIGSLLYASVEYFFASKIVLSMAGAQEISRSQAPEFYAAVDSLSVTAGIPMPKVYIVDDPSLNAFAAGNSPQCGVDCAPAWLLNALG